MPDILVLCYHALSEDWPDALAVRPADFERQVQRLLGAGYVPATFTSAITAPPARRTLAITFDDAYRSVPGLAGPILARLAVPATVYAPTAYIGSDEPMSWPGIKHWATTEHRDELRPASWAELAALQVAGWEIGSHTRTHRRLPDLDDAALLTELTGSRRELEDHLGVTCASIAYPYGAVDRRVAATAGRAGYRTAATLPENFPLRPRPLLWPRVGVYRYNTDAYFQRQVSRWHRALQPWPERAARLRIVERARRGAGPGARSRP